MDRTFDIDAAIEAQERYCKEHQRPNFAPTNGYCDHCGKNIYNPITLRGRRGDTVYGISVEEAGTSPITSCPHCQTSFVD